MLNLEQENARLTELVKKYEHDMEALVPMIHGFAAHLLKGGEIRSAAATKLIAILLDEKIKERKL